MIDRRNFTLGAAALGLGALATPIEAKVRRKPAKMLDVLVLGAGGSGLQAAWLLEQQGLKVKVLEGRKRVGGRIATLMDQPGYPEMGFNSMADGYGRGFDAAERAGVELVEVGERYRFGKPPLLWINGKPLTRQEWAAFPGNPFPDSLKTTLPGELVAVLVSKKNPLADWTAWNDPANAHLDISLHEWMKAQGLSDEAIRLGNDVSPYYGTTAADVSALMLEYNDGFVKAQFAAGPRSMAVKGGNIKLAEGMARLLKGDVLLGKEVIAITSNAASATVHCRDGSQFTARKIVCSLPFSTLRKVKILPGLKGVQAEAVARLPYQPLSMVFLTATSPFWDEDGLAPGMWTDGIAGNVMVQRFGSTAEEITGFIAQARGGLANQWDAMGRDAVFAAVTGAIGAMRPAAKGKLRAAEFFSWKNEGFNLGDWAYFGPGHISKYVNHMAKPAGRIHFCGEHTATGARGLEGAFESAERVALEVLGA